MNFTKEQAVKCVEELIRKMKKSDAEIKNKQRTMDLDLWTIKVAESLLAKECLLSAGISEDNESPPQSQKFICHEETIGRPDGSSYCPKCGFDSRSMNAEKVKS